MYCLYFGCGTVPRFDFMLESLCSSVLLHVYWCYVDKTHKSEHRTQVCRVDRCRLCCATTVSTGPRQYLV